jgi:glutamate---cysteine ligase / carboxylate-amine ligase
MRGAAAPAYRRDALIVDAPTTAHWSDWQPHPSRDYTLGVEEEVMLLNPHDWSLAQQIDRVIGSLPPTLAKQLTPETHKAALELGTKVHTSLAGVDWDLRMLRNSVDLQLSPLGLRAAAAGTHPLTVWHESVVSSGDRHQQVYGSMRELARREPTFALHVHVGVRDPDDAIRTADRMRAHLPLLLALSANSPFWQGRDTGLASVRTPVWQAFPRVGIPRAFGSFDEYVLSVDRLIRCGALPDPTFLWWDIRPQPRYGTVEVRVMDVQTTVDRTLPLVALVQCLARLECEEGYASSSLLAAPEVLDENRFLAARDGVEARLISTDDDRRVSVRNRVDDLMPFLFPHAQDLGCEAELVGVAELLRSPSAARQLEIARGPRRLPGLVEELARQFAPASGQAG